MRPHYNVVIVGAGASGISLLNKIVETLPEGLSTKGITIAIADSGPECGGRAYPPDSVTNLMNTKCGAIDRGFGGGYGFLQWAAHNESKWRPLMGGDEIGEDSYVPRPAVGLYLADLKERAIRLGRQRGFVIDSIDDDVHDISVSGEHYAIKTKGGKLCDARYVYLALGHLEPKQTHSYQRHERYYNQPYPIRRLQEEIPKDARVGVIGTRLSAIDVTLGLASAGHTGSVTCISRSGRLPAVRAERGSYRFQEIEREDLVKLLSKSEEKLRLTDIVNMLNREIAFAEGRDLGLAEIMRNDLPPIDYYRNEIALSKGRMRPWQSVLYATNRNIDLLWHYLEEDDKQLMMSEWLNDWLTYRASIPRENAERMLALMESGLVAVEGGARGIRYNADSAMFEMLSSQRRSDLQVDYLVSATGSANRLEDANSTLMDNLLANGMVAPHRYGGIDCLFHSGQTLRRDNRYPGEDPGRMFAIGPLTSGVYFFTTALEIIERQAARRAGELALSLGIDWLEEAETEAWVDAQQAFGNLPKALGETDRPDNVAPDNVADVFERIQQSGEQMKYVDFEQLHQLNRLLDVHNVA